MEIGVEVSTLTGPVVVVGRGEEAAQDTLVLSCRFLQPSKEAVLNHAPLKRAMGAFINTSAKDLSSRDIHANGPGRKRTSTVFLTSQETLTGIRSLLLED